MAQSVTLNGMTKLEMISARSLRDLLIEANRIKIKKKEIVDIVPIGEFVYMIYEDTKKED